MCDQNLSNRNRHENTVKDRDALDIILISSSFINKIYIKSMSFHLKISYLFIFLCLNWFILNTQPGFFFFKKKRTWKRKELLTDVETWPSPSGGPCLASPKSESFALKFSSSRTLEALKSRNISCSNAWQTISTQTAEKTMQYITNRGRHLTELEGKSLELSISKDHI